MLIRPNTSTKQCRRLWKTHSSNRCNGRMFQKVRYLAITKRISYYTESYNYDGGYDDLLLHASLAYWNRMLRRFKLTSNQNGRMQWHGVQAPVCATHHLKPLLWCCLHNTTNLKQYIENLVMVLNPWEKLCLIFLEWIDSIQSCLIFPFFTQIDSIICNSNQCLAVP